MNILFTVCGRAGSKGVKNKNIKDMNGVPLVYYSFAAVKEYQNRHPEHVYRTALNTDSTALIETAKKQKALDITFVPRKEELAGERTAKVDVIKDTYLTMKAAGNYDVVIDLDITSPVRRAADLENIMRVYNSDGAYDLVFSVVEARRNPYFNMVEKKPQGYYEKVCRSDYTARQQAPDIYELNGSIYAYRPEFLESEITRTILDYQCGIVQMPDFLVLDIDSEEDFEMMQFLHRYYMDRDEGLKQIYLTAKEMVAKSWSV